VNSVGASKAIQYQHQSKRNSNT